jgi:acyl-homoserine-lactone acylase
LKNVFPLNDTDAFKAYALSLAVLSKADETIKDLFDGSVEQEKPSDRGSNGIAISRNRTNDGCSYLAVNSHQPLEGPVAWYEAHLISEEGWNMLGGLFPGSPVINHGTNEHLGWAHTVNFPDKIDVYRLEINPQNPDEYLLDDEWTGLESRKVKLKVKVWFGIKLGVKKEVLWSAFGPVIKNKKGTFAFNLSALEDIGAIEQWYEMNKATNYLEFKEVLSNVRNPGFNIVYADKEGNVSHFGYARIPLRDSSHNWRGVLDAKQSSLIHRAYHSFADLPKNENPASGIVFNTNNSAFSSSTQGNNPDPNLYDQTMGYDQWENNRSIRFISLIDTIKSIDYQQFKHIKYDIKLPDSLAFPNDYNGLFKEAPKRWSEKARESGNLISYLMCLNCW